MCEIFLKKIIQKDLAKQIEAIGFDKSYLHTAQKKYHFNLYKIFNLKAVEANILKQIALSVGSDCAVHSDVITSKIDCSDCILSGTDAQIIVIIQKLKQQPFGLKKIAELLEKETKREELELTVNGKTFNFSRNKYIMGILNITPDSFSDGGDYSSLPEALKHVEKMLADGADIIDLGAESTRPGAKAVEEKEEQERLLPVLNAIKKEFKDAVISVDTRNAQTADIAIKEGANIVNDISSFEYDPNMLKTVVKFDIPYILTDFQMTTSQENITDRVYKNLLKKTEILLESGVKNKNIIIDIGIGFGKTVGENFELIKNTNEFTSLGYPLLVGHSRKSFLGKTLNVAPKELDCATAAISLHLFLNGANILRVHNVALTKQMLEIANKI